MLFVLTGNLKMMLCTRYLVPPATPPMLAGLIVFEASGRNTSLMIMRPHVSGYATGYLSDVEKVLLQAIEFFGEQYALL